MKKPLSFLACTVVALAAFLLSRSTAAQHQHGGGGSSSSSAADCQPIIVTNLTPFLDLLLLPTNAVPARTNSNYPLLPGISLPEYDMPMVSIQHKFHHDLPPVEVFAYSGQYPGPSFQVTTNLPVLVNWSNSLAAIYPSWLTPDTNIHGVPDESIRTVVHLHGGASRPQFDGYPTNWFRTGQSAQYLYENIDLTGDGETLWYHDHAIGVTANNVYAGLEGFYFLRTPVFETNLNIPLGDYELPLLIQDRDIQTNCVTPTLVLNQGTNAPPPWHALAVVNGIVTPYFEVEPRRYRLRVLNGANFRTFGLQLTNNDNSITNQLNFNIIGTESGFLPSTVTQPTLRIMPAERFDIIVDFSTSSNQFINLINSKEALQTADPGAPYITNVMQFRVTAKLKAPDTTVIPTVILTNYVSTSSMVSNAVVNRPVTLDLCFSNCERLGGPFTNMHNNAFAFLNLMYFEDPINDFVHAGDTEVWELINLTSEPHPIHVHLLDFRVVSRQKFATTDTNAAVPTMVQEYITNRVQNKLQPLSYYLVPNDIKAAQPYEAGPKDVVHAAPFAVTRIVMEWPDDPRYYNSGQSDDTKGRYIYHCHILDHEDNDMMRPMQLIPPRLLRAVFDETVNPGAVNKLKLHLNSKLGMKYRLLTSATLGTANWVLALPNEIIGTGSEIEIIPPPSTDRVRFYRAEVVP